MLPDVGIDGEVCIQLALKHTPSYFYTSSTGWVSMQLLDQVHHPYISTSFGGKHFNSSLYISRVHKR